MRLVPWASFIAVAAGQCQCQEYLCRRGLETYFKATNSLKQPLKTIKNPKKQTIKNNEKTIGLAVQLVVP